MQNIIFLTEEFIEMIKASGLSLDCLSPTKIGDVLSGNDVYDIDYMTTKAREDGNILSLYGFGFKDDCTRNSSASKIVVPKDELDLLVSGMKGSTTPLEAYCPDEKSIILWIANDISDDNSYSMFQANLRRVLKAMTRVLSYQAVLQSSQFELAILRD